MVVIRKIFFAIKAFLIAHYKLSCCVVAISFVFGCVAIVYSKLKFVAVLLFASSILAFLRLLSYKKGKLPFIMIDRTWNAYRLKYSCEEAEQKYKTMSISRATVYFIVSVISFLLYVICEAVCYFFI